MAARLHSDSGTKTTLHHMVFISRLFLNHHFNNKGHRYTEIAQKTTLDPALMPILSAPGKKSVLFHLKWCMQKN